MESGKLPSIKANSFYEIPINEVNDSRPYSQLKVSSPPSRLNSASSNHSTHKRPNVSPSGSPIIGPKPPLPEYSKVDETQYYDTVEKNNVPDVTNPPTANNNHNNQGFIEDMAYEEMNANHGNQRANNLEQNHTSDYEVPNDWS